MLLICTVSQTSAAYSVLTHEQIVNLPIGSFRHSMSNVILEMTRVALLLKKDELVKENPTFAKKKFLYNFKRSDFEREWDKSYQKPGTGARIIAAMLRILPKVGPFKALSFKMPSPNTETLYLKSVKAAVEQYRSDLNDLAKTRLTLSNTDFDTGKATRAGEYRLTDSAYAKLLNKLADAKFAQLPDLLRRNILDFYSDPSAAVATKRKIADWNKTLVNIQQLKAIPSEAPAGFD